MSTPSPRSAEVVLGSALHQRAEELRELSFAVAVGTHTAEQVEEIARRAEELVAELRRYSASVPRRNGGGANA
ncbi:hypothetical protein SAMN04487905_12324 [Actinopolyspora xinjiangensis]|uniref:Uncharacterized protein n=1 Tax=Actinopolyspora xinjiangensis TaxID=405564 RepID=A0A1H0X2N2_9ACTN|nr:hypothetical protein [Actinopolyspora xinjiangensis]SDP97099.1 hypothetical protein SAMN04487905_12324 [Actinopolyspora xinjiangensis]